MVESFPNKNGEYSTGLFIMLLGYIISFSAVSAFISVWTCALRRHGGSLLIFIGRKKEGGSGKSAECSDGELWNFRYAGIPESARIKN